MGISRGWWRLSFAAGLVCLIAALLWIGLPVSGLVGLPVFFWLRLVAMFGILPAAVFLFLGWIVGGFRARP